MVTQPQAPNRSIGETICRIPAGRGCDTVLYCTVPVHLFYVGGSDSLMASHKIRTIDRGGDAEARSVSRSGRHERCNAAAVQPRLRVQTPGLPLHANFGSDSELRVPECFGTVEEGKRFVCISSSSDRLRHVCIRTHLIPALRGFKPQM